MKYLRNSYSPLKQAMEKSRQYIQA